MFEFLFGMDWEEFKNLPWWAKILSILIDLPLRALIGIIKLIFWLLPSLIWGLLFQ